MAEQGAVRRRLVFYISGFDPRGPRFYHQLYKTEAAKQEAVNGCRYQVSGRTADGDLASCWTIKASSDTVGETETRYTFLRWDDIVRDNWPASKGAVIAAMVSFYRVYASHGVFAATRKVALRTFWTSMSPAIYTALLLALAGGLGVMLAAGITGLAGGAGAVRAAAALAGLALGGGVVWAGIAQAERMRMFWLMRILVFCHRWAEQGSDPHADRWAAFARRIQADIGQYPADEVLLVGHSVGAPVAVAVAARLLELQRADPGIALSKVKLLTLGQVFPLLGMIPQAGWFRAQMQAVGDSDLPWLDCTAPGDPLSFVLVDPFRMCGLATPTRAGYRIKSSRFDKMFAPKDYAAIRRDAFRVHFQYLMARGLPANNVFFAVTAGAGMLEI